MADSRPTTRRRAEPRDGQATQQRVLDAALSTILERGIYRASSNEIARRAGVTWGVIQHHFGTRRHLMAAALQRHAASFADTAGEFEFREAPGRGRLAELFDLIVRFYGTPNYFAWVQLLIEMRYDTDGSPDAREVIEETLRVSQEPVGRLVYEALGDAGNDEDYRVLVFSAMRGLAVNHLLLAATPGLEQIASGEAPFRRQQELLLDALVALAHQRGMSLTDESAIAATSSRKPRTRRPA
jgi:AcrR family transcriptional regulator